MTDNTATQTPAPAERPEEGSWLDKAALDVIAAVGDSLQNPTLTMSSRVYMLAVSALEDAVTALTEAENLPEPDAQWSLAENGYLTVVEKLVEQLRPAPVEEAADGSSDPLVTYGGGVASINTKGMSPEEAIKAIEDVAGIDFNNLPSCSDAYEEPSIIQVPVEDWAAIARTLHHTVTGLHANDPTDPQIGELLGLAGDLFDDIQRHEKIVALFNTQAESDPDEDDDLDADDADNDNEADEAEMVDTTRIVIDTDRAAIIHDLMNVTADRLVAEKIPARKLVPGAAAGQLRGHAHKLERLIKEATK